MGPNNTPPGAVRTKVYTIAGSGGTFIVGDSEINLYVAWLTYVDG